MQEYQVTEVKTTSEMDVQLDKIKENKILNDKSSNPFIPKEREWIQIGSVKIDRSEYALGEKIFVNIDALNVKQQGKVEFLRPLNDTHYQLYYMMEFDTSKARNNFYITPDLSIASGICDQDQLIGNWKVVVHEGTMFWKSDFTVTNQIVPGYEERYLPKC